MRGAPLRRDLRFTPTGMDFHDFFLCILNFRMKLKTPNRPPDSPERERWRAGFVRREVE